MNDDHNESDRALVENEDLDIDSIDPTQEDDENKDEGPMPPALSIKAIEFDWIFNSTQGYQFLETLSNSESIEIFGVPLIRNIIEFLWGYYRKRIFIFYFLPFAIYLILFCLDCTLFHPKKQGNKWGDWYIVSFITQIIIVIFSIYFYFLEFT
jgi:hypothetical protein